MRRRALVALALGGCAGKDGREGDVITAIDGSPLDDEAALGAALLRLEAGQHVVPRVYRGGRPRDVKLTLGTRPKQADIGVQP